MSQPLSFTRIFAQPDGTSRMVRSELPLALRPFAADTPPLEVSAVQAAHGFQALRFPADWAGGWHRSPHRQWGFVLSGAVSVTTSDGVSCELRSGDAFLLEDLHGQGHLTRVIGDAEVLWISMQIPGDAVI